MMMAHTRHKRRGVILLLSLAVVTLPRGWANPAPPAADPVPRRAETFARSIGVNVHLAYTNSSYRSLANTVAAIRYLGIDKVRDVAQAFRPVVSNRFAQAAAAGIKFDFVVMRDIPLNVAWLQTLQTRYPGSVAAIEGPNEVNNWPITYDGLTGTAGAQAFQTALYRAVKANPVLKSVPVYNFTDYPDYAGAADFANIHVYPKGGNQPRPPLGGAVGWYGRLMPGKPTVVTEVGYPTLKVPTVWGGVDRLTQARLTLNLLLDAESMGVRRVFLYQLFNAYPDPSGRVVDKHLGLFDLADRPKPVATAIRNLVQIIGVGAPGAQRKFSLRPIDVRFKKLALPDHAMVFQRADGTEIVALWNEHPIWTRAGFHPITLQPSHIKVMFSTSKAAVAVYDPIVSAAPIRTQSDVRSLTVALGDDPLLIEVKPN